MRFYKAIAVSAIALSTVIIPSHAQAQEGATFRVGQFSSDAGNFDVYLDGTKKLGGLEFPKMSNYYAISSGTHKIELRTAGDPASSPAIVTKDEEFGPGKNYTFAAVGLKSELQPILIEDDLNPPLPGNSKIRVINAISGGAGIDVATGPSEMLAPAVAYASASQYIMKPIGTFDLALRDAGTQVDKVTKHVELKDSFIYTIVAVTGANGGAPEMKGFRDKQIDAAAAPEQTTIAPNTVEPTTVAISPADPAATPTTFAAQTDTQADTQADSQADSQGTLVQSPSPTTPDGGVATGFGGMNDRDSTLATLGFFAVAGGFLVLGLKRRSSVRR